MILPLSTEPTPVSAAEVPNGQRQLYYLEQARSSLNHLLNWHRQRHSLDLGELQPQLEALERLSSQLNRGVIQIVVFGLVSRGKSAVLNALMGEKIFSTGPLHGVTQWPRSGFWQFPPTEAAISHLQVEFIDTPGLEEIEGQQRADMARMIGQEAELILFVTTGEPTAADISALRTICGLEKPVLLVVNKADLYPNLTPADFYQQLNHPLIKQRLSLKDIVFTAAAPAPVPVRLQWPSGRTSDRWETPPPQVDTLKQKLLQILAQEGSLLIASRTLIAAQSIETTIAEKIITHHHQQAQALLGKFIGFKGLAVALNPFGFWDVGVGMIADLLLIRSLSRLYGLPITRHSAGQLWKTLLSSAGGLLVGQLLSGLVFDESAGALSYGFGSAIVEILIAGYGAYMVSRGAQTYLSNGSTWGALGCSTVLQTLLNQLQPPLLLYRLRPELINHLHPHDLPLS